MAITKRLHAAYDEQNRARDCAGIAERRVSSIIEQLFTALKDREKTYVQQQRAEARLRKVHGF